jgi:hypothetical protein
MCLVRFKVVHEVLASRLAARDRYALTLWFVADSDDGVCDEAHPLAGTRREHFPAHAHREAPDK